MVIWYRVERGGKYPLQFLSLSRRKRGKEKEEGERERKEKGKSKEKRVKEDRKGKTVLPRAF